MDEGSYGGGFSLGFLLGLVGLIIAIAIDKPLTKKGGLHGFLVSIGLGVLIGVCVVCAGMSQMGYLY